MHTELILPGRPFQEERVRRTINAGTLLIVLVAAAWIFYAPLRDPARIMSFVEDDFYYYLKVARNVSDGRGSTFNGITRTNGYHPLYLLVISTICKCTQSVAGIFRGLWLVWVSALVATFVFARRLLERPDSGPWLANALALLFLIPCVHLFCQGMEVTLTVPLAAGLMLAFRSRPASWTLLRAAGIGLLAALTVLSRLDSIFLVLLLLLFTLVEPEKRQGITVRQISGFALGGGPLLAAYFLFNRFYFHTWMPVSGSAKQLKSSGWPTITAIRSAGLNTQVLVVFLFFATIAFWVAWNKLSPEERPVLAAAAAFPYVQLGVLSFLSDWPLWGWYFYSMRIALLAGLVLLLGLLSMVRVARWPVLVRVAPYAAALMLFLHVHYKKDPEMDQLYTLALEIQSFEQSHPGIYAMGGGAGMPGYLLADPVVQAEGLMMDSAFLQHIRHQDDLVATLGNYGVRYYVATEVLVPVGYDNQREGKCFLAEEPYNIGRMSLRMRARLCDPPGRHCSRSGGHAHLRLKQPASCDPLSSL
jgi:hypothetical protein